MRVSVIVCTYDREIFLPETLDKLVQQDSPNDNYEVLIIDNNSKDKTAEISNTFIANNPNVDCQYFFEPNQGHTYARNRGIKESKYEILSFIDDDAFVRPDFISNLICYFKSNLEVLAIGGKIIPIYESKEPKWMSPYLWPLVAALDMGDVAKPFRGTKFPIGANMAFRKEVFDRYGLFDVNLGRRGSGLEGGDEKEMFIRLKVNKELIHYVPSVTVDHIIPEKRIQLDYIKGLAIGVGTSERKRLANKPLNQKINKVIEEMIKIVGTLVISLKYLIMWRISASTMLIKFRWWVINGYLK